MEKNELIRKYELVVIVDARLGEEAKEAIRKSVTDEIKKKDGKIINSQVWLEKNKLTFQIKKCSEGTYYIINFEGESDIIEKVKPSLKLNEQILRFEFIKIESKATATAASA